jgi:1,4-dihydroxy-2-naphthoyl-CoA hydrolase
LQDTEDQQRREALVHAQPPFAQMMGIRITHVSPDRLEAEVLVTPQMANRNGVLHGGAVMGIADNLGGSAAVMNVAANETSTTVESKTNFFRSVDVGDTLRAVAEPLHKGRRTQVWQTRIFRGDNKLAAIVTQTQMTLSKGER